MKNTTRLLDVLDRAENGPIVEEQMHDMMTIPGVMAQLRQEHDVTMNHLEGAIIPSDDTLADRVWEAGLKMAEELGFLCLSTSRRMLFTRDEILTALQFAPTEITVGEGLDRATERKRTVEDTRPIFIKGGGVGTPLPEDVYLQVHQSYAQEPLVDAMINCTLESVYGREGRSRSPWEVLLGWQEFELSKAAARRAGRPGLGLGCVENSVSEIAELSATSWGGFSPNDWHHVAVISEFKTDYFLLTKVAHLIQTQSIIHSFYNTIYGGTVGGKEAMAIAIVGGCILMQMVYMTSTHSVSPTHPFYGNDTTPEILQAISVAQQALARNSRLLTDVVITPVGGPGTRTLLYEVAATAMMATASGACALIGPRSAVGTEPGYVSGLEARFGAEVAHATAGMSRKDANAIAMRLVEKFKPDLDKRPIGKHFCEVYDVERVQPKPEWLALYEDVKQELRDMGLPLD
ncbi:MAG: monomethylamine:corrinoid methyltransferase [Ardenticatenaceae bacterium]|nr:monomethylamine:corrinoid methyltransferase [Ardenticatenaceae bacterium]